MLGQGVDAQLAQVVVDGFNGDVAALLVVGIVLMTVVEVYLGDVEAVVSLVEAQIVGACRWLCTIGFRIGCSFRSFTMSSAIGGGWWRQTCAMPFRTKAKRNASV